MIREEEYIELKKRYNDGYRWIARDKNGYAYTYYREPKKLLSSWKDGVLGELGCFALRINMYAFPYIKWEDEKPTRILDLIQDYEAHQIVVKENEKVTIPSFVADWIEEVKALERPFALEYLFDTTEIPNDVFQWRWIR